ncbi:MAG: 1-acyl-sn-glycerol-3-phosphate acyltransferase [Rikenellaceae bacterium]|nr:1-acyl-sn-glycerol-3-phosphate acyltransferase [Rikenellaceae bacterium]
MIFNIFYYLVTLAVVTIALIITVLVYPFTVPSDKARRVIHEISRVLCMFFFRTPPCWKTRVRGLEHIERGQTYVIVLNHRSMVDIPMLYWVPLNFRWVSKSTNKKMPFIGQFMWLHGDMLIPTQKPQKAASMIMHTAPMWLKDRGVCVAIFPEGSRSKTEDIQAFKPTAFALAERAGVGILPVVLDGSKLIGKGGKLPWKHTFTVQVLEPVSAETVTASDPKALMNQTRDRMIEAKRAIKQELKELGIDNKV